MIVSIRCFLFVVAFTGSLAWPGFCFSQEFELVSGVSLPEFDTEVWQNVAKSEKGAEFINAFFLSDSSSRLFPNYETYMLLSGTITESRESVWVVKGLIGNSTVAVFRVDEDNVLVDSKFAKVVGPIKETRLVVTDKAMSLEITSSRNGLLRKGAAREHTCLVEIFRKK